MDLITIKAYLYRIKNILKNRETFYLPGVYRKKMTLGNHLADWTISTDDIKQDSIVYCFGVGQDISFDLALIQRYKLNIHAFDPSPVAINWMKTQLTPNGFYFYPFGLGGKNGKVEFSFIGEPNASSATILNTFSNKEEKFIGEIKSLKTIMLELGHNKIDLLKMDIEGAEYEVIENILHEGIEIQQLLIEFHHRFRNVGKKRTRNAVNALKKAGFRIFHISPSGEELSFYNINYKKNG
jgi:FkbM family methyltransferase